MSERYVSRGIFEQLQRELRQWIVAEVWHRLEALLSELARICGEKGPEPFTKAWSDAVFEMVAE